MSTPTVTHDVTRYTRRISFTGAEPVLLERRYGHGGKKLLPDTAEASWSTVSNIDIIEVSGVVVRKDGTPGIARTEYRYAVKPHRYDFYPDAPDWLLDLFGITTSEEATA